MSDWEGENWEEEEAPPYFDPIAFAEAIGKLGDVLSDMADLYAVEGHDSNVCADVRITTRAFARKHAEEKIHDIMSGVRLHYGFLYADEVRRKDALTKLAEEMFSILDTIRMDQ